MLIDWFTVGAQALNFLILVWLLKHFLYKPIRDAIDAREKGIAGKLTEAEAKTKEAQKQRDDFAGKNKVFDEERAALASKAADEARVERDRLIGEANKEAEILRVAQATALRKDYTGMGKEITRTACDAVFAIARKALADLATESLEERMGAVFTHRLSEMSSQAKQSLGAALQSSQDPAIVQTAFDMPAGQRAVIQNALNETFSAEIRLRFEAVPDQVCGIELTANGQKVGWSIAEYLITLDQKVGALLETQLATK